jgi:hypothetical protein
MPTARMVGMAMRHQRPLNRDGRVDPHIGRLHVNAVRVRLYPMLGGGAGYILFLCKSSDENASSKPLVAAKVHTGYPSAQHRIFSIFAAPRYPHDEKYTSDIDARDDRTYKEQMSQMQVTEKLAILADAAKYDASCASSGTAKRSSSKAGGIGSTEGMGICHAYAPDGRCISLLKILLTNACIFDCHYCINRKSSNVRRAAFATKEVVDLTLNFYKRNYIEGLFLSSGIIRSSNYTMEQIVEVARSLREDHDFRGYIHLKTIPDADPELLEAAGRHADRLSINVELPTRAGLNALAPEKSEDRRRNGRAENFDT